MIPVLAVLAGLVYDRIGIDRISPPVYSIFIRPAATLRHAHTAACELPYADEASLSAEERVHVFVLNLLRRFLDPLRPRWHGQLMAREMASPTRIFGQVIEEAFRPKCAWLQRALSELCGDRFSGAELDYVTTSILGQCTFYRQNRHVVQSLFPGLFSPDDLEYSEISHGAEGLELADSITGDCHKLLNVPYDCGIFFTRHKNLSEDVFRNGNAPYLTRAMSDSADEIQSPMNIGIENSRRFRALPVYTTVMTYGRDGYLDMLRRQIGLARRVTSWLLRDERFEVLPSPSHKGETEKQILAKTFIVVLFRVRNEEAQRDFVKNVNAKGRMYISGTVWEGKSAARIAVSNWQADVQRDGDLIEEELDLVVGGRK